MRVLYRDRQEALLEAVSRELSGSPNRQPVQCSMHVVARFHNNADDREIVGKASRLGVIAHPLSGYYMGKRMSGGLLLGFAAFDCKAIQKGYGSWHKHCDCSTLSSYFTKTNFLIETKDSASKR